MGAIQGTLDVVLAFLPSSVVGKLLVMFIGYSVIQFIVLAIYRLYFSPLAGFPGSKLAACTGWYEFYFDVIKPGKYLWEIERMHKVYGPIIRVTPHELSIHDPEYYNQLYVPSSVRRSDLWDHFAEGLGFEGSHLFTIPHDLHRRRRKPLEPFFSRSGATKLEPVVNDYVGRLSARFEALRGSGSVVSLDHAFVAFAGDVMMEVLYGPGLPSFVEEENYSPFLFNIFHNLLKGAPLFTQFPFLMRLLRLIPDSIVKWAVPESKGFDGLRELSTRHVSETIAEHENPHMKGQEKEAKPGTSLFRHILNSDMPKSELSLERLMMEGQNVFGAGTATTARTLEFICYYILADKQMHDRLREELRPLMSGYPAEIPLWSDLEKLPFLQAIIKEGLRQVKPFTEINRDIVLDRIADENKRLSYGLMHRLPRVSPDVALTYKEWTIPKGVPVGMSAYLMHSDPDVYPEPFKFLPERWLGDVDPLMNRNFVPFSKGSRNCLGMSFASVEMIHILAMLFRPGAPAFDLYETDETDVTPAHDVFLPLPRLDSKGVRVIFH